MEEDILAHFDVIISGCGPTGGVLANLLASKGRSVLVLDKYKDVYPQPRAIVLDWEVMRALQAAGVADELYPGTKPHPGTNFLGLDGQVIKLFDPAPPPWDLGWPATLTFIQPELEEMLRDKLAERPTATLGFGTELIAYEDRGDTIHVTLRDRDTGEESTATAGFLVGCDGANSVVRNGLGFALEGLGFDELWVVVDAWQQRETPLPPKTTQYCWPSRPATYVVGPRNLRRWELKLLPGETAEDFDDAEVLKAAMRPYVDPDAFEIWRHAVYRFNAAVANGWRKGRVMIAGDAAHTTPPFLAQGLCAGLRDAFNLGWKLDRILTGGAPMSLLESYQLERKPHVSEVVQHAKDFGLIIGEMDVERARIRDKEQGALLASGRMVTTRQKFIPDLRDGCIAADDRFGLAGAQMVQPKVEDPRGTEQLLDDIAPYRFLYVTHGNDPQAWLDDASCARLGLTRLVINEEAVPRPDCLFVKETDGIFANWVARTGCHAVIVRPDCYVFSGIADADDLRSKLALLAKALGSKE